MATRLFAVFCLLLLAPLIAEYLLGSLPVSMLPILPVMVLMYGSGAVLIREIVRQTGKGWPSLILLATAYGFVEEGLVTQSLFNPNYLHLRLLDFGFIPAIGTSLVWSIYVLALHMFWSISTPIGLTESLFPKRGSTPWLGKVGLGIMAVFYIIGSIMVAGFTYKMAPFMAQPAQLIAVAVIVAALVIAAFAWPKAQPAREGRNAPHPVILFLMSFVPGSLFVGSEFFGRHVLHLEPAAAVAILILCQLVALAAMIIWTRGRRWTNAQRYAVMLGAFAVYVWLGVPTDVGLHGKGDLPGHMVLMGVMVAIAVFAGVRATTLQETIERQL